MNIPVYVPNNITGYLYTNYAMDSLDRCGIGEYGKSCIPYGS